ncbi:MAG: chromosome segregation protein SMC, partial [Ferruginibacter sp.]|nr:chromosome segregation protein SMC [Cytophagales bacterium]
MQLSKLEVKGFKSFGDKITIHFDQGVTGIVGPNGCGKSNVVDAIRWVLGEQKTRALRSDKMENVIFNGTKNRKALQMAEASLTFNNTRNLIPTEYSQVTITRKYYRTGEGEYLLNGISCRLKDITNLFLDTGIGPDSYAIIELKMVDDLLNDKDNARRGLFEEAAGVAKFKLRKKETLRKMEDTNQDLERVEDLLFEIGKNAKVLEKQARQAQHYYQLKGEYKQGSVALARKTVRQQSESLLTLDQQMAAETDRKTGLNAQLATKEADLEKEKAALIHQERLLAGRQRTLNEHVARIRQYESERKLKNERRQFLNDRGNALRQQLAEDGETNQQTAAALDGLREEGERAGQRLAQTRAEWLDAQRTYEHHQHLGQELQRELNAANQAYRQQQEAAHQATKSLEIKQLQLSSLRIELEKTASDTTEQTATLGALDQQRREVAEALETQDRALTQLRGQKEAGQEALRALEAEADDLRDQLARTSRGLDARRNEYRLTKAMADSLDGFPEAIKFLKTTDRWEKQVPLLSDLLTCGESDKAAVERFLEPFLNHYVVETQAQALRAVALLDEADQGRASFFVLDQLPRLTGAPGPVRVGGVDPTGAGLVRMLDVVDCEARYQPLVRHLLREVFIADDPAAGVGHRPDPGGTVTRDGRIVWHPYGVSGGSAGALPGKRIGQAQNLEKLAEAVQHLTGQTQRVRAGLEAAQERKTRAAAQLAQLNARLQALEREVNGLGQEHVRVKTQREQFVRLLDNQGSRREEMLDDLQRLRAEIEREQPLVTQRRAAVESLENRLRQLNGELVAQNERTGHQSTAYHQANAAFYQQQNRVNSLEQETRFRQRTREEGEQRAQRNAQELQKTESDVLDLMLTSEINDDQLAAMYAEQAGIEQGLNEAERAYYAGRGGIDKLEKELREVQRQREGADALLASLREKRNETRLGLTATRERLSVEFDVDLDGLPGEDPDSAALSEGQLREKVQQWKKRLDEYGPINPMAMEAHQEIKQRFDFIDAQKQDLLGARNDLLQTIAEIDTVARENFLTAFHQIRENFIGVFRSLFSEEDACDLSLSDPANPLESDIEII